MRKSLIVVLIILAVVAVGLFVYSLVRANNNKPLELNPNEENASIYHTNYI